MEVLTMDNKLLTQLRILKMTDSKPNFSELSRIYNIDRRTITKNNKLDFTVNQISKLKKESFDFPRSIFYSCKTASSDSNGKNFAKKWSRRFWSTTTAYDGKTTYEDIREPNLWERLFGRPFGAADNYPVAYDDAKRKTYTKTVLRAIY